MFRSQPAIFSSLPCATANSTPNSAASQVNFVSAEQLLGFVGVGVSPPTSSVPTPVVNQPLSLPFLLNFPPSTSTTTSILMDTVLAAHKLNVQQQQQSSLPSILSKASTPSTSRGSPSNAMKGERCVGCGSESAIRVHYGASSCHGCKAFFRRSVFEGRVYMCSAENNCDITNESRNRCRSCRLRNCLEGGMNPKHVREERSKIERMPTGISANNNNNSSSSSGGGGGGGNPGGNMNGNSSRSSNAGGSSQSPPGPDNPAANSEQEGGEKKIPEEHQVTLFMCALEKQTEMLTDDDVRDNDVMGEWSRDISLTFGLQHPQMVIRRHAINYACERIMEAGDLYLSWYRSFVLHADWAMGIPDFRVLPLADQTTLFKQNFMAFGWITYAYKCYEQGQQNVGIPLGNGAYIPYTDDEQKRLPQRWAMTYGVVCKKLMDLIVRVMTELNISEEEYCLVKTISLFQQDCILSDSGMSITARMRDRLLEALSTHIERRFPHYTSTQRTMRALKLSLMLPSFSYIGQIESTLIQQLTASDLHQLSGVPMEICAAQQAM